MTHDAWSNWSSSCANLRCGEGRKSRTRKCLNKSDDKCEDEKEIEKCFAENAETCPSACCNRFELSIPEVSGAQNKQSHRSGTFYQRDQLIDGKASFTNNRDRLFDLF